MTPSLTLEAPENLRTATTHEEVQGLLPFTWQIGMARHRQHKHLQFNYKPELDQPNGFTSSMNVLHTAPRRPSDSYLEVVFPFTTNAALRTQYRRFNSDKVRMGLLLEDFDTLAADIAARHSGMRGATPATAFVDRISFLTREGQSSGADEAVGIPPARTFEHDLRMAGEVTWVGKTSMEVLIELSARPRASAPWQHVGFAYFLMVLRDFTATSSMPVPPLLLETAREKARFELGEKHMERRRQRSEQHWRNLPPPEKEVRIIHDLAVRSQSIVAQVKGGHAPTKAPSAFPQGSVQEYNAARHWAHVRGWSDQPPLPMKSTEHWSSTLMHSQDRNNLNNIFGGHLLRLAFEHAFATAAIHAGEWCDSVSAEDVAFLLPVPIGVVLQLRGKVVYTSGHVLRVAVEAIKVEPTDDSSAQPVVTNTFTYAFAKRSGLVRGVVPETVVEAMQYVHARRQHIEWQGLEGHEEDEEAELASKSAMVGTAGGEGGAGLVRQGASGVDSALLGIPAASKL